MSSTTKGFNCVLFDFDSIVDKETSLLKFFYHEYRDSLLISDFMDIGKLVGTPDEALKFTRMYGKTSLFKELLIKDIDKERYETLIDLFFERDQKEIFESGCGFKTLMINLIFAFKKVGGGIISATVRCDNQIQADFLHKIDPTIATIISKREDVDMSKFARLMVGSYKSALEYVMNEPKVITVLNFRENYSDRDTSVLQPELVINLGDINEISIASAYQEDEFLNKLEESRKGNNSQ